MIFTRKKLLHARRIEDPTTYPSTVPSVDPTYNPTSTPTLVKSFSEIIYHEHSHL